jgi:hypothetical protein
MLAIVHHFRERPAVGTALHAAAITDLIGIITHAGLIASAKSNCLSLFPFAPPMMSVDAGASGFR